jgi:hypothetical protein
LEDRYPSNTNTGPFKTSTVRQQSNLNASTIQNTPHSVSAARAAGKSTADTSSNTSPFYSGAINWMTTPMTGVSQMGMSNANTGAMPLYGGQT